MLQYKFSSLFHNDVTSKVLGISKSFVLKIQTKMNKSRVVKITPSSVTISRMCMIISAITPSAVTTTSHNRISKLFI